MIGEDVLGKLFTCMGAKDDSVAKELLAGKVGAPRKSGSTPARCRSLVFCNSRSFSLSFPIVSDLWDSKYARVC